MSVVCVISGVGFNDSEHDSNVFRQEQGACKQIQSDFKWTLIAHLTSQTHAFVEQKEICAIFFFK